MNEKIKTLRATYLQQDMTGLRMRSGDATSDTRFTAAKTKTYKLRHTEPGDFKLDYILLPMGFRYNADIQNAKKGEHIRFYDGLVHEVISVRKLKIGNSATDILCRMRYGIPLKAAMERWKSNAILEGHGAKAVSADECLWVIYGKEEAKTD